MKEVAQVLMETLALNPSWKVKASAAEALGKMRVKEAVEPMLMILQEQSEQVQSMSRLEKKRLHFSIIDALGELRSKEAVEPLLDRLDTADEKLKSLIIDSLGQIKDERAVRPLLQILRDDVKEIRQEAAKALMNIGKPAVSIMLTTLGDSDPPVQRRIINILGSIGHIDRILGN